MFSKRTESEKHIFQDSSQKTVGRKLEITTNLNEKKSIRIFKHPAELTKASFMKEMENNKSGKSKKITNKQNKARRGDELTEQVTETTFSPSRMVGMGAACSRTQIRQIRMCLRLSGGQ